jgi:poly-gamma-glutamate synthesis protein (capsule biosynthesis protein)
VLNRADVLFGNMESVTIPPDFPREEIDPGGMISLLPGEEAAAALRRVGFDVMNMAANHVLDAGSMGLDHTRACLESAGIVAGGVGYSQAEARQLRVIERNGLRLGFVCYGEDSNWTMGHTNPGFALYELDTVVGDVRQHRSSVDALIVSIHADLEFMPTPSVPRLRNSRAIAEAGATVILEHHPHVPQGVEMVNGSLICYSLGNFVFDAHTDEYMKNNGPHTAHSFVLLVELAGGEVRSFERVPFEIGAPPEQRPLPLEGAKREQMLAYLADLDGMLQDEELVKRTWRATATKCLSSLLRELRTRDVESVIQEMVGRSCILAENRSWMQEILEMGREHWEAQKSTTDPYHRPEWRCRNSSRA